MGLLKRWFGHAAPVAAPPAAARPASMPPSRAAVEVPLFGARRPLVAAGGAVAGFEFELAPGMQPRRASAAEPVTQAAHAIALLASMRSTVETGRVALATLPTHLLERPAVLAQAASGTMLVPDDAAPVAGAPADPDALASRLRAQGVRIGGPPGAAGDAGRVDFIMLAVSTGGLEALLEAARACRVARPGITLVATGFDGIDDLEQALEAGVTLVAGRMDTLRGAPDHQPLQADLHRICLLLNRVGTDQDTALIARDLSQDVALSYRLLRYVNSPALGLVRAVDSIEQAVMLLGRQELYRWLSVLLLSHASGRKSSPALQEIALARARLLETLARERGSDPPDALFTVGLLSLLDVMLKRPLAQALGPLKLGDAARQALLERRGEWHDYLALATELEHHDLDAAAARAQRFGGLEHVLEAGEQSWRWAAAVQGAMHG